MRIAFRFSFAASMLLAALTISAAAQDFLPELVKRIKPSAVAIETFDAKDNTIARGSGFFIAPDRIITNRHVIEKSSRVEVHLLNGKKFPVRGVLAIDGEGDLALLSVDVPKALAVPLPARDRQVMVPPMVSRRKMSQVLFVSGVVKFSAKLSNTTYRPSPLIRG